MTDPQVHDLAAAFVDDLLQEHKEALIEKQATLLDAEVFALFRTGLVERAAEAMQRAIEDECQEIERELLS